MKRLYLQTIGRCLPTDLFAKRFPVSVKGVVAIDGQVVLVQNEHGHWDLPGGKLHGGESFQDCLTREMKEELGIAVTVGGLIDMVQIRVRGWVTVIVPIYQCVTSARPGDLRLSAENSDMALFSLHEISSLAINEHYRKLLLHQPQLV